MALNRQKYVVPGSEKEMISADLIPDKAMDAGISEDSAECKDSCDEHPIEECENSVDLEELTSLLTQKLEESWRNEEKYIMQHSPQNSSYLKGLKHMEVKKFLVPEIAIALFSDVSGGKSSFLNNIICHYPISPVANTTTSTCALEVRRAYSLEQERVEVCLLTDDKKALEKKPVQVFHKQRFEESLFRQLLDYAFFLADAGILDTKANLDFFRDEKDDIILNSSDWRHCMVLLMIVLDAYVYQDKQNDPNLDSNYKAANEQRNELLRILNVPVSKDYGLRLYWNSDQIPGQAVIVDLPGTGSATASECGQMGHTELVGSYLADDHTDSLLFFIDETATIKDPNAKMLLDAFLAANSLKGDSSARVTIVLNKADKFDEVAKKHRGSNLIQVANSSIQTTIRGFRQSFPDYDRYPIYALSSWDGEWLLLDSGIPLRNLHHAAGYIANMEMYLGQLPEEEKILEHQKKRFERAYPCQSQKDGDYVTMDITNFARNFFTDYIRRIQFLSVLEQFEKHLVSVKTIADAIAAEYIMFQIADKFTPVLAESMAEVIRNAMKEKLDDLYDKFSELNYNMQDELANSVAKVSGIIGQFDVDYLKLNEYINNNLQNKIASLEKDEKGRIPIDGNILGTNALGIRNRDKIKAFADQVAQIPFMRYFETSFTKLEEEFDRERDQYQKSITQISDELTEFPKRVIEKMQCKFDEMLSEKKLEDVWGFTMAFNTAKTSTERLLITVCKDYANDIQNDKRVDEAMKETAKRIQLSLQKILSPYTDGDYGARILNRISKIHIFGANVVNLNELKKLLTTYYIFNFRLQMDQTLVKEIQGSTETKESHIFRVSESVEEVGEIYLSSESLERIKMQVENACNVTDGIINDPALLDEWGIALSSASINLQDFFADESIYDLFGRIESAIGDRSWARASLKVAREIADEAATSAVRLIHK